MFITTAYITNVFAQLQLLPYTRRAAHRTTVDTSSLMSVIKMCIRHVIGSSRLNYRH